MLLDQSYSLQIIEHRHPSEIETTLYAVLVPGLASPRIISTCYFLYYPAAGQTVSLECFSCGVDTIGCLILGSSK